MAVLASARQQFLTAGFGGTTVAEIARASNVSPESIYKNFGGKAGLVKAIHEQSLRGTGAQSAEQRSDLAQSTTASPEALMDQLGRFSAEVGPLTAPISLLIRDAAVSGHSDMADLRQDVENARHRRMLHNARQMEANGILRPGLGAGQAADIMFACTTPELFESLVLQRGWTPEQYGRFIAATLAANLL